MPTKLIITLLAFSAIALTSCSPREIDRTERRPHTAMRGVAYKKLILTLNEANALAYRADQQAQVIAASDEVDDQFKSEAIHLAETAATFADDIEWSLANNQRMTWHRTEMNRLWNKYKDLYPEDKAYAKAYKKWSLRKPTPKLRLKFNYDDNYGIEKTKPRWNDLQPVIRELYETE